MIFNKLLNTNVNPIKMMLILGLVVGGTWVTNVVTFIQTVTASDFVLSEIGTFTIIQGIAMFAWPIALVTGPMSLFM